MRALAHPLKWVLMDALLAEGAATSRRDRPWRLTTVQRSWSRVQPDGTRARAAAELERVLVQHEMAKLMRWEGSAATYAEYWRRAAPRPAAQTWLTMSLPISASRLTR